MRRLIRLVPFLLAVVAAACDLLGSDEPNLSFDSERIVVSNSARSRVAVLAGNNLTVT